LQPLVISFYTLNTPYEQEVKNLLTSCENWEIPFHVEGRQSKNSWHANCAMKPFFILEQFKKWQKPLFWIDADAIFLQKPDFTPFLSGDLSIRSLPFFPLDHPFHFFAGSFFIHFTSKAQEFLERWCAFCEEKLQQKPIEDYLEQNTFFRLLRESSHSFHIQPLPTAYAKIFDLDSLFIADEEVIVEHAQASRRFKDCIHEANLT
jgi:hypothetical protein